MELRTKKGTILASIYNQFNKSGDYSFEMFKYVVGSKDKDLYEEVITTAITKIQKCHKLWKLMKRVDNEIDLIEGIKYNKRVDIVDNNKYDKYITYVGNNIININQQEYYYTVECNEFNLDQHLYDLVINKFNEVLDKNEYWIDLKAKNILKFSESNINKIGILLKKKIKRIEREGSVINIIAEDNTYVYEKISIFNRTFEHLKFKVMKTDVLINNSKKEIEMLKDEYTINFDDLDWYTYC